MFVLDASQSFSDGRDVMRPCLGVSQERAWTPVVIQRSGRCRKRHKVADSVTVKIWPHLVTYWVTMYVPSSVVAPCVCRYFPRCCADVAELADSLGLGFSARPGSQTTAPVAGMSPKVQPQRPGWLNSRNPQSIEPGSGLCARK